MSRAFRDAEGQVIRVGDIVEVVEAAPESEYVGVRWIVDSIDEDGNVWVHREGDPDVTDYFWSWKLRVIERG